jgi:hypothetical protein
MKEKQIIALQLLAKFKFLTSSLFVLLSLYKNRGDVTNALKPLLDGKRPMINKKEFQPNPIYGKVESVYYLTQYGKKYLETNLNYSSDKIKYVHKEVDLFQNDYNHRIQTVSFYIRMAQWLDSKDGAILFCNYYFDKAGNNRIKDKAKHLYPLNRLELQNGTSFIPDIITKFSLNDKEHIILFEQHNGNSVMRLTEQLESRRQSIEEGIFEIKFDIKKSPRVAIVCESEIVKTKTIEKLKKDMRFNGYHNFFIFKTNSELEDDFNENWSLIDGQKVSFMQSKK